MMLSARIGAIEFDGDEVRLAVVKTGGRTPVVLELHACRAVYAEPEGRADALGAALREAVRRVKNRPAAYVLCVSSRHGLSRLLTLPFRGRRRVAAAVRFELEPFLAFPVDELVVDFNVVREYDGQTEVFAIGMRRDHLAEQIATAAAAGIEPEGICLVGAGLTALWHAEKRPPASSIRALLHLRDNGSTLAVAVGRSLALLRHLPTTAAQLLEEPALAGRLVQNTLRAFTASWEQEAPIEELVVTGVHPSPAERRDFEDGLTLPVVYEDLSQPVKGPGLARRGQSATPVSVSGVEPGLSVEESVPERINQWEALVGAGVSSASGLFAFDFRKGELSARGAGRGLVRHLVFSAGLGLLLLLGYAAYCYIDYQRNMAEIDRIGNRIWELYAEAFPDSSEARAGRTYHDPGGQTTWELMQREMSAGVGLGAYGDPELFTRPILLDVLQEISEKMPDSKVRVTVLRITPASQRSATEQRVRIEGEVTDPGAFNDVVNAMKQSQLFRNVGEPSRRGEGGRETFVWDVYL